MLITCPECKMQISNKAIICPHCGYPLIPEKFPPRKNRARKKKLPNGFGQITELKQNLRNPFRAMITIGFNELGKPICKLLSPKAYFPTYNDAYQALMEYNQHGNRNINEITFKDLYNEWSASYFKNISKSAVAAHTAAWKYLTPIYSCKVADTKIKQIKNIIENANKTVNKSVVKASSNTKKNIKILLNLLYDFAIENEIVDKNYARSFNLPKSITKEAATPRKTHIPFSVEEKQILWKNINDSAVKMILMQCLTGFRPQEFISILTDNVSEDFIVGGMKTDAGKDRLVPIHSSIQSLVLEQYVYAKKSNSKYLFFDEKTGSKLTTDAYRWEFNKVIKKYKLNSDHRPHDPRKDFVTTAKKFNVDEYALKRIIGHSIKDITEKVYTERDPSWLKSEIEKIKIE